MPRKPRKKLKNRVRRDRVFFKNAHVVDTITNYPLDDEGIPLFSRAKVEERKFLHAGWHQRWRAILTDDRDRLIMREVIH